MSSKKSENLKKEVKGKRRRYLLLIASLLQFEDALMDEHIKQNIKNMFDLDNIPCDTYMRERLDEVNPQDIRPAFTKVFSALQRGKELEKFVTFT